MYTIYFDLDGTILDVAERYYRVHCDACAEIGVSPLPANEYWELKRDRKDIDDLPGHLPADLVPVYQQERVRRIESPDYLVHDRLLPGALEALTQLATRERLVLVTMRRDPSAAHRQLRQLGIDFVFDQVFAGHSNEMAHWRSKARLIEQDSQCRRLPAVVVGDTEADILAGKSLGLATIAVLSGLRNRTFLEALQPNRLLANIAQLPKELYAVDSEPMGPESIAV